MRLALLLVLLILPACTSSRPLTPATAQRLHARSERRAFEIRTHGGARYEVRYLSFEGDTIRATNAATDRLLSLAVADVRCVTERRVGRGALQGLGLGVAIGTVGAAAGFGTFVEPSEYFPRWANAILGAVLGFVGGAVVGPGVGALRGHRVCYEPQAPYSGPNG